MSIRNKLILMLALPLAALAFVGALGFRGQSTAAQEASEALEDDAVIQGLNQAIKAMGAERIAIASGFVGEERDDLRAATDARLIEAFDLAETARQLPVVETALSRATSEVNAARIDTSPVARVRAMNRGTQGLRDAREDVEVQYPSQRSFAEATSIDFAVDIADRQDSIWLEYITSVAITPDVANRMRTEIPATEVLREQIVAIAPPDHAAALNASLTSSADANINQAGILAIERFENGDRPLLDDATLAVVVASHEDWFGHAIQLQNDVSEALEQRSNQAQSRQNLFASLGTLGLLVLFGLIYVVYRSVVHPLDELLAGAEHIATDRLPSVVAELRMMGSSDAEVHVEPLVKEADDELGSLVDAFNDVQVTAFDLAVEQARSRRNIAEMFVNLGRRNQKLLQRMLSTISTLEQDEKDPEKLEQLFQLDHMTTRMRRNAESLLVVAGTTTPRQWAKPVSAAEVVRSALAEVQEYLRVDVLSLADAPMAGNAVADVTHLLAELLENSLQFSEPGSRVTISSRWKDGNYRIVINDQGFGMTPDELAEHNSVIADPPPPDEAPTRFLGLFVVGHLAKRHGIDVVLTDATIGGTDARVSIPGTLMSEAATTEESTDGLPVRSDELDFDAELAKLTIESDLAREAELGLADQPVNGDAFQTEVATDLVVLEQLPPAAVQTDTFQFEAAQTEVGADLADLTDGQQAHAAETFQTETLQAETLETETAHADVAEVDAIGAEYIAEPAEFELPVPTEPVPTEPGYAEPAEMHPDTAALPVRNEAPIDFGSLPELPHFDAVPATATPARVAPDLAAMGLPQRTPRATLGEAASLTISEPDPAPAANPVAEPEDVSANASQVGSMFSAFQAGVQRGEQTTN